MKRSTILNMWTLLQWLSVVSKPSCWDLALGFEHLRRVAWQLEQRGGLEVE